ncbi:MAG: response regulator transcription factor [Bacteroidota bacterium]
MEKINLIIADDHPIFRDGLKATLKKINIVGKITTAQNGLEVLDALEADPSVDIIFMDIEMPVMDGIAATKIIRDKYPEKKVIVLTMFTHARYIIELYDIGVAGYIIKNTDAIELTKALKLAHEGEQYYSRDVHESLFKTLLNREKVKKEITGQEKISEREIEIMKLICEQHSTDEIGERLFISPKTVKRHRQILFDKTGSKNLAGLVVYAIRNDYFKVYSD